jgi:hypothetical protein
MKVARAVLSGVLNRSPDVWIAARAVSDQTAS